MKYKTEAIKYLPVGFGPSQSDQDCTDLKDLRVVLIRSGVRGSIHHAMKRESVIWCFIVLDSGCSGWFTLDDLDPA